MTDAMAELIGVQDFTGVIFEGERYDCGHKLGFIEANLAFALDRADMRDDVAALIKRFAASL